MSQPNAFTPSTGDEDRRVIASLAKAGADLSKPRLVTHYLYFETAQSAEEVAQMLPREGFKVDIGSDPTTGIWQVKAEHQIVVNLDTIEAPSRHLYHLASCHGGDYDGWETQAKP